MMYDAVLAISGEAVAAPDLPPVLDPVASGAYPPGERTTTAIDVYGLDGDGDFVGISLNH